MGSPKGQFDTAETPRAPQAVPPMYIDLDKLENADRLVAIISQRRANGVITFALFKEFDRDGRIERTSFIADTLRPSYLDLQRLAFERIDAIKADPDLLAELQRAAGYEPTARQRRVP